MENIPAEVVINAIGIGLVVSLIFSESMGLAAGGMVVPGYIALSLRDGSGLFGLPVCAPAE